MRVPRVLARGDEGAVTVEMALASLMLITLITGMISFGTLYLVQSTMSHTARDTVRRMATGELSLSQAQTYAQNGLFNWGITYTVNATNDGSDATVQISVPMRDAAMIDFLGIFTGNLQSSVTMAVEP